MVTPGIACLASPVFSHEGVPVAAVGLTYVVRPRARQERERRPRWSASSPRLSSSLGHSPEAELRSLAS